jgi:hypothetical protein
MTKLPGSTASEPQRWGQVRPDEGPSCRGRDTATPPQSQAKLDSFSWEPVLRAHLGYKTPR